MFSEGTYGVLQTTAQQAVPQNKFLQNGLSADETVDYCLSILLGACLHLAPVRHREESA